MHPAFDCFEWGTLGVQHSHPNGEPARPKGPWNHVVLTLKRTNQDIGEVWFRVEEDTLTVDVRVQTDRGGADDPWLIRLVGDSLFGSRGFLGGYYDKKASRIRYRNLVTSGLWDGTWGEMRHSAEPDSPAVGGA